MEKLDLFYDFTKMDCFCTCRRKYFIRFVKNLTPKEVKTPLDFGSCFHKLLSRWYGNPDLPEAERFRLAVSAFADYADRESDPLRTKNRAYEIFTKYLDYYPQPESWKIVTNEIPVELLMLENESYRYFLIGKIDLVVQIGDFIYGIDHKTTSQLGDSYFKKYEQDMQMSGYSWYLRHIYGDMVQGMIINAISTAKTAGTGKVKAFDRAIANRSSIDIKWYPRTTLPLMEDIQQRETAYSINPTNEVRDTFFYPTYSACRDYGACEYRDYCLRYLDPEYEKENLVVSVWDPRTMDE